MERILNGENVWNGEVAYPNVIESSCLITEERLQQQ